MHRGLGLVRKRRLSTVARMINAIRRLGGSLWMPDQRVFGDGEPNLLTAPEFAGGLADAPTRTGLVTLSSLSGYDNALAFGHDGSTLTLAYKSYAPVVGLTYTLSAIVKMDDGLAPTFATPLATSSANTFAFVFANDPYLPAIVSANSDGTYRVSATVVAPSTLSGVGVIKYASNNNRTFKVTGYKLEPGTVATPYTPQSVLRARGAYVDITGVTPVTAVADLIGLITDKTYGGALGVDLITSPSATGAPIDGVTAVTTYQVGDGMAVGKFYRCTYTVSGYTGSNDVGFASGSFAAVAGASRATANGVYSFIGVAINPTIHVFTRPNSNTCNFSVITVCEVPGTHATQSAVASKPTVTRVPKRLGPNLVTNGTFDSGTSGWTAYNSGSVAAVSGELVLTNAAAAYGRASTPVITEVGKTYQLVSVARAGTSGGSVIGWSTVGNSGFTASSPAVTSATNAATNLLFTATTTSSFVIVQTGSTTSGQTAIFDNIEVREVLEWANVISFDGNNDFLQTGITTGNEGWLAAGVTLSSGAPANQSILYSGADADVIAGAWLAVSGGAVRFGVGNGTTRNTIFAAAVPIGTPQVIDGGWDATLVRAALNGAETTLAKTVNCTTSRTFRIGLTDASWPLGGSMHAAVYTPVLPDAATRKVIRDGIAALQGRGPL